jgi:MFS family permease
MAAMGYPGRRRAPWSRPRLEGDILRELRTADRVLLLLCLMYFITYVDRVNVSTAGNVIQAEFHLSNTQFGEVFSAFALTYLIIQFFGGQIADRFGARRTLFGCALIWATATILTSFANGLAFLFACRLLVGVGEGASFATASRAVQSWMPNARRGFAQGLTHACARLGNAATPPLVATLIGWVSWRGAFAIDGLFSLLWGAVWYAYYRDDPQQHRSNAAADKASISPPAIDRAERRLRAPARALLLRMLPVTVTYFCYGWTLWMLLSWLPRYFLQGYGLDLKRSSSFAAAVFLAGVVGDGIGGIFTDWLLKRSNLRVARVGLIWLSFSGAILCLLACIWRKDLTSVTVGLTAAFFFLELSIGAFWAIPGDIAPAYSGSASGFMNIGSALAAVVSPPIFGEIVDASGDWNLPLYVSIGLLIIGMGVAASMRPDRPFHQNAVPGIPP